MTVQQKIIYAIQQCEKYLQHPNDYLAVPFFIRELKEMLESVNGTITVNPQKFGGIGYIVLDYMPFAESKAGKAVLDALHAYNSFWGV